LRNPAGRPDQDAQIPAHSRRWDLITALPLILFNAVAAVGFAVMAVKGAQKAADTTGALQILSEVGSFVFFSMEAVAVCIRRLPLRKLPGLLPRASALLAAYAPLGLLLLPRVTASAPEAIASILLLLTGTVGGIVTLTFLGRSFAILPQARRLVTGGPYRYVRHPLYLFGQISLFGVSLQFAQPWALMIAIAGGLLQFPRMAFEERVLLETFPDYAAYRAKTPMIVPGL
jgi:protein-S-isoprenylcysteine O-methyltransferase Ste14